jgi:hypothetical protein
VALRETGSWQLEVDFAQRLVSVEIGLVVDKMPPQHSSATKIQAGTTHSGTEGKRNSVEGDLEGS